MRAETDLWNAVSLWPDRHPSLKVVNNDLPGWGRAVKTGFAAAKGGILCYTNSARTDSVRSGSTPHAGLGQPRPGD